MAVLNGLLGFGVLRMNQISQCPERSALPNCATSRSYCYLCNKKYYTIKNIKSQHFLPIFLVELLFYTYVNNVLIYINIRYKCQNKKQLQNVNSYGIIKRVGFTIWQKFTERTNSLCIIQKC